MKNDCVNKRVSILSVRFFFFFFFFSMGYTMLQFMYKWWRQAEARIILNKKRSGLERSFPSIRRQDC